MRTFVPIVALGALTLALPSFAGGGAPAGSYSGTAPPFRGTGGAHKVSFAVSGGVVRGLSIGPGKAYCHPPNESGLPGSSPQFFLAGEAGLSGFPALKTYLSGSSYELAVTLQRFGTTWKPHKGLLLVNGPMYLELNGYFIGTKFSAISKTTPNFELSFGADATGKPNPSGPLECNVQGILVASRH